MKFNSANDLANWLNTTEARDIWARKTPNMVTTSVLSKEHRFRWFNIASDDIDTAIGGDWLLGANLHFSGNIGGVWVSVKYKYLFDDDETQIAYEVHPWKPVRNPLRIEIQNRLINMTRILENWNKHILPSGAERYEKGHLKFKL